MTIMKLTLQHLNVRSTHALDSWIEKQIFALQPRLAIEEARVRLTRRREASPPYEVNVHLVTPGPDVFAEGRDHTLRAAVSKVMAQLHGKLVVRNARQKPASAAPRRGPDALRRSTTPRPRRA